MTARDETMTARDDMREARKAAGLCLHSSSCGNKALAPPVVDYCEKHLPEHPHQVLSRKGKKRPPSN
jgi:hypothetical protein